MMLMKPACEGWGRLLLLVAAIGSADFALAQDGELQIFAVVTKPPKDKAAVTAQVVIEGIVSETKLIPSERVLGNPVWRTLEMCHSLKAEVKKLAEGYQVLSVRILDASMLPMNLQSTAGDCLIQKAIEVAPLVD
ncbi:MAG: hypothetical protein NW703_09645 [Nitrospiraceae bacterium]